MQVNLMKPNGTMAPSGIIGEFRINANGKLQFHPCGGVNSIYVEHGASTPDGRTDTIRIGNWCN